MLRCQLHETKCLHYAVNTMKQHDAVNSMKQHALTSLEKVLLTVCSYFTF